jgi:crotonobetainyl-CoA:carnitine CoA-transferase CaiB-like acyl-CoA transferase
VIKVERPGTGDFARGYDGRVHGLASHFVWTNRSKQSLTLDVKHPEAAPILAALTSRGERPQTRTARVRSSPARSTPRG